MANDYSSSDHFAFRAAFGRAGLCFIAFLEAADGTRKPSPPRMLAMTFMRLWKCISFFDGEPRHLSS
ncbi:hypothetical protein ACLMJW_32845, partial [Sinorhizobium meliloti]